MTDSVKVSDLLETFVSSDQRPHPAPGKNIDVFHSAQIHELPKQTHLLGQDLSDSPSQS